MCGELRTREDSTRQNLQNRLWAFLAPLGRCTRPVRHTRRQPVANACREPGVAPKVTPSMTSCRRATREIPDERHDAILPLHLQDLPGRNLQLRLPDRTQPSRHPSRLRLWRPVPVRPGLHLHQALIRTWPKAVPTARGNPPPAPDDPGSPFNVRESPLNTFALAFLGGIFGAVDLPDFFGQLVSGKLALPSRPAAAARRARSQAKRPLLPLDHRQLRQVVVWLDARLVTPELYRRRYRHFDWDPRAQHSPSIDIYRGRSALPPSLAVEIYRDLSLRCMRSRTWKQPCGPLSRARASAGIRRHKVLSHRVFLPNFLPSRRRRTGVAISARPPSPPLFPSTV